MGMGLVVVAIAAAYVALRIDRWANGRNADASDIQQIIRATPADYDKNAGPVDFRPAAKKIGPAVVSVDRLERIQRFFDSEVEIAPTGSGSGVIISPSGYILTNNHVVAGGTQWLVHLADGRAVNAKLIGTDPRSDIAVLKIDAPNLTPAELGDSKKLEVGEWVIACGNPLGYSNTLSVGVVSSLNRTLEAGGRTVLVDTIQTDAAINQGNSGGALANLSGQLVGINSAIASNTGGGSIGIGFAIPINRAKKVVDELLKYGRVRYGYLGAVVDTRVGFLQRSDVNQALAREVGATPPKTGLLLQRVVPGSAVEKIGLKQLDILLAINGQPLREPLDLTRLLNDTKPGDKVQLKYWSAGSEKTAEVTLQDVATSE